MINKLINSGLKLNNRIVKQTNTPPHTDSLTHRYTTPPNQIKSNEHTCESGYEK